MTNLRRLTTMEPQARPNGFRFGQHLVMNLLDCPYDRIADLENLTQFVTQLVPAIGMVPFGPIVAEHFGHASSATSGYTVTQLIETSLISGHMVDDEGTAWWDVFSCKPFDLTIALDMTNRFFTPGTLEWMVLYR